MSNEVQRLRAVYHRYQNSKAIQERWSTTNPGNRRIIHEREQHLCALLDRTALLPLAERRILDIGCGSGRVLARFTAWGAQPENLYGIDLLQNRARLAHRLNPALSISTANAEQLPFAMGCFDLVLLFTVFTSILEDDMARKVAGEVQRVLKGGGSVLWYDFRYYNPRNPNVRAMTKARIQALFPYFELQLEPITLLPPLARRLGAATTLLYPLLAALPALRTHYIGLLHKPTT